MISYYCYTSNPETPNLLWTVLLRGVVKNWRPITIQIKEQSISLLRVNVVDDESKIQYSVDVYGMKVQGIEDKIYQGCRVIVHGTSVTNNPRVIVADRIDLFRDLFQNR